MTDKQAVLAFIDRINAHDVEGLGALMSGDHTFVDAHGNQVTGKEKMIAGWRGYFEWFPDYFIEVSDVFGGEEKLALFGFGGGILKREANREGRRPGGEKKKRDGSLWRDCVGPIENPF